MEHIYLKFIELLNDRPIESAFCFSMLIIILRMNKRIVDLHIHAGADKYATEKNIKDDDQKQKYIEDYDYMKEKMREDYRFIKQIFIGIASLLKFTHLK